MHIPSVYFPQSLNNQYTAYVAIEDNILMSVIFTIRFTTSYHTYDIYYCIDLDHTPLKGCILIYHHIYSAGIPFTVRDLGV